MKTRHRKFCPKTILPLPNGIREMEVKKKCILAELIRTKPKRKQDLYVFYMRITSIMKIIYLIIIFSRNLIIILIVFGHLEFALYFYNPVD